MKWPFSRQPSATFDFTGSLPAFRCRVTPEFGDIDERFYGSLESALQELANLLRGEARDLYPQVRDRLAQVEQMADGIGWGYGDFVTDLVYRLEEELGNPQS